VYTRHVTRCIYFTEQNQARRLTESQNTTKHITRGDDNRKEYFNKHIYVRKAKKTKQDNNPCKISIIRIKENEIYVNLE